MKTRNLIFVLSFTLTIFFTETISAQEMELVLPLGHQRSSISLAYSPDGRYVVESGTVWEVGSGRRVRTTYFNEFVNTGFVSKDGKRIHVNTDLAQYDVDFKTGKVLKRIGHFRDLNSTISPSGKYWIGKRDHEKTIFLKSKGEVVQEYKGHKEKRFKYYFDPNETYIISRVENGLERWDLDQNKARWENDTEIYSNVAFSSDSQEIYVATTNKKIKVLDAKDGHEIRSIPMDIDDEYYHVTVSPNGDALLVAGKYLVDIKSGAFITSFGFDIEEKVGKQYGRSFSNRGAFNPEGDEVFLTVDGSWAFYNVSTGGKAREISNETVSISEMGLSLDENELYYSILKTPEYKQTLRSQSAKHQNIFIWDLIRGSSRQNMLNEIDTTLLSRNLDVCQEKIMEGKYAFYAGFTARAIGLYNKDPSFMLNKDIAKGRVGLLYNLLNSDDWIVTAPDGRFDASQGAMKKMYYVKGLEVISLEALFEQFYTPGLLAQLIGNKEEVVNTKLLKVSDLKSPPLVKIVTPDDQFKSESQTITVTVKATNQGGGVDEIRLYHNDKLVNTTQRGFKATGETKNFTISLISGQNRVRATAFNDQRTESNPDEISVFFGGAQRTANLHMLVIGVNAYKNPKYNLNYAKADAVAFKNSVENNSTSIFENVNITYMKDAEVTRSSLTQTFEKLKSDVAPEDVFVFYYAGHGVMSDGDKTQFYIVPNDVTQLYGNNGLLASKAISAKELKTFSTELKAQKQLFVLDACQSGGMTELLASRGASEEKAIAQLARSTGTYWLTASGSEQFATEFAALGHGLFTYTLLEGMSGKADGGSKDGKITVKELSAYLNDRVPELSEQHKGQAQYPTSYGFGQDFPIVIVE